MAQLEVNLVAADRSVWTGAATMVVAPAADGEMGILAGHQPVLSVLNAGSVRIRPVEGEHLAVQITGGFLSMDSNVVTIVADGAEVLAADAKH